MVSLQKLSDVVRSSLISGGEILLRNAKRKKKITFKSALDPVTHVDLAIEKRIIGQIRRQFPHHGFIAEESAYQSGNKGSHIYEGYRWIIDPLDGTVNFVHGIPQSCVSVAVALNGITLAGGIFDPYRNELFIAVRKKGARLNGVPISVSKESQMKRSILITGFPYKREKMMGPLMKTLGRMLLRCADVRRFGSAALDLSWIACGRAEGYWESTLNPWDVAAGVLLVQEAGGRVTTFDGEPFHLKNSSALIASNKKIHSDMLDVLKKRFS